ncbi:MAG TPA: LysM domain-containing protein [Thermoanaerobaculia bacterium]|jgi:hypothetical protein|nr:LysM domain-containing protein [Thermoanaerobaculia bacterium]
MSDDRLQRLLEGPALAATAFPANSRYHGIGTLQIPASDGSAIVYLKRRFIAQPDQFTVIGIHFVTQSDRLDNIAARNLGDPELFWRICDANVVIAPDDLTETIGEPILITLPEGLR